MIIVDNNCLKGARTLSRGDVGVGEQNHHRGGGKVGLLGGHHAVWVENFDIVIKISDPYSILIFLYQKISSFGS